MTPGASLVKVPGSWAGPCRFRVRCIAIAVITLRLAIEAICASDSSPDPAASRAPTAQNRRIRIASYNVDNYAVISRPQGDGTRRDAGKEEAARDAVARMIAVLKPEILGLMEIGDAAQFEDLRARLKKAGMDYPYSEYVQGADPVRHVALLSRFPVTARNSEPDITLPVDGIPLHSPRGILDVTIEPSPGKPLRLLCVHLKAKLGLPEYDETRLREAEAVHLRKRIRDILRSSSAKHLVVMGDFNDTPDSKTLREIEGKPEWNDSLHPLSLTDDRGETWTEHWESADVYSRIDYILLSHSLEKAVLSQDSGVFRPSFWKEASDHCPVFTTLTTTE